MVFDQASTINDHESASDQDVLSSVTVEMVRDISNSQHGRYCTQMLLMIDDSRRVDGKGMVCGGTAETKTRPVVTLMRCKVFSYP